jgi:hypothetical protein
MAARVRGGDEDEDKNYHRVHRGAERSREEHRGIERRTIYH